MHASKFTKSAINRAESAQHQACSTKGGFIPTQSERKQRKRRSGDVENRKKAATALSHEEVLRPLHNISAKWWKEGITAQQLKPGPAFAVMKKPGMWKKQCV